MNIADVDGEGMTRHWSLELMLQIEKPVFELEASPTTTPLAAAH